MRNLVLLFIGFVLFFGCSKNYGDNPIIGNDKFVDILVDIHLADATLVVKGYRINTDSTQIRLFYNDVLIKHKVTQKQIQNTFEYYAKKPKEFEHLYEEVSERIVKMEQQYLEDIDLKE